MSLNIREDDLRREGSQIGERIGFERGVAAGRSEGMLLGRKDGIAEGARQGAYQNKLETAAMKLEGFAFTMIAKITGLSVEEIEKL